MTLRLWLVRHGATDWSDHSRFTGWTDVPLNRFGQEQASRIGKALCGRQFTSVWSSDLRRAVETARIAIGGAVSDSRLRELDFGELEGARWEDCPPAIRAGLLRFDRFEAPGGESVDHMRSRILDYLSGLQRGEHLVFTHGGVIRLLLRMQGIDGAVPLGSVTSITWPPGRRRWMSRNIAAGVTAVPP